MKDKLTNSGPASPAYQSLLAHLRFYEPKAWARYLHCSSPWPTILFIAKEIRYPYEITSSATIDETARSIIRFLRRKHHIDGGP